jgi:hypothetical protein
VKNKQLPKGTALWWEAIRSERRSQKWFEILLKPFLTWQSLLRAHISQIFALSSFTSYILRKSPFHICSSCHYQRHSIHYFAHSSVLTNKPVLPLRIHFCLHTQS